MITTKNKELSHCPPHFTMVPLRFGFDETASGSSGNRNLFAGLTDTADEHTVRNWLHANCENRFYVGKATILKGGVSVDTDVAAFENPADATYFTLVKPTILQ